MGLTRLLVWTTATALPLACCPAQSSATASRDVTSVLLNQTTHNGYDYITRDITTSPGVVVIAPPLPPSDSPLVTSGTPMQPSD
jgi:hypothetical protein